MLFTVHAGEEHEGAGGTFQVPGMQALHSRGIAVRNSGRLILLQSVVPGRIPSYHHAMEEVSRQGTGDSPVRSLGADCPGILWPNH